MLATRIGAIVSFSYREATGISINFKIVLRETNLTKSTKTPQFNKTSKPDPCIPLNWNVQMPSQYTQCKNS